MSTDCEFLVRVRPKTGNEHTEGPQPIVELCSLTGRTCFCPSMPLMCTRRTWALEYDKKQQQRIQAGARILKESSPSELE